MSNASKKKYIKLVKDISQAKHYKIVIEPTKFMYYGSIVSKNELDDR
jgi:hypothetical protein